MQTSKRRKYYHEPPSGDLGSKGSNPFTVGEEDSIRSDLEASVFLDRMATSSVRRQEREVNQQRGARDDDGLNDRPSREKFSDLVCLDRSPPPRRQSLDSIPPHQKRIILSLDLDAFYVAASRKRDPSLQGLPIGIKQKGILATVSYEARKMGVEKLSSVSRALTKCPDLVLVDGEDLSYFRHLSREVWRLVKGLLGGCGDSDLGKIQPGSKQEGEEEGNPLPFHGCKVEKLGMDELFCDVTDLIDLNYSHPEEEEEEGQGFKGGKGRGRKRFFRLFGEKAEVLKPQLQAPGKRFRERRGFLYDAGQAYVGHRLPADPNHDLLNPADHQADAYTERLHLATHLANHIRTRLSEEVGLTCSAGVAHSKMLAKLVGNMNKPNQQTCLVPSSNSPSTPPLDDEGGGGKMMHAAEAKVRDAEVKRLIDPMPLRSLNGFGSASIVKIMDSIQGGWSNKTAERIKTDNLTISNVRRSSSLPSFVEMFGSNLGTRLWGYLQGRDEEEVQDSPEFPLQISVEDSYRNLLGKGILNQLELLSESLLKRLEFELCEEEDQRPDFSSYGREDHLGGGGGGGRGGMLVEKRRRRGRMVIETLGGDKVRSYREEDEEDEEDVVGSSSSSSSPISEERWNPSRKGEGGSQGRKPPTWRRYPRSIRLSIRKGWNNRVSKQAKMPVGIFDLEGQGRSRKQRSRLIYLVCVELLRNLMMGLGMDVSFLGRKRDPTHSETEPSNPLEDLGSSSNQTEAREEEEQGLNLINIAALQLVETRPPREILGFFLQTKKDLEPKTEVRDPRSEDQVPKPPSSPRGDPTKVWQTFVLPDLIPCRECGSPVPVWFQHDHRAFPEFGHDPESPWSYLFFRHQHHHR
ncbi:DNA/RNA polymerase [Violaceomyces palustris]|uniref:DNA/RNA polymerase n=1 Tax=Violaceomyces palustris TaxID=1673888 RepID=A0ACD0P676_9BASI|nr:DNA/RNA polymerase [Violaceomyces palustris]